MVALGDRTLTRILDRQRGGDDEHFAHTSEALSLQDHPAEPRIDRQAGQPAADRSQRADAVGVSGADRRQFFEQQVAVTDRRCVGRLDERKGGDVAEPDRRHLQDDGRQVGAQDLRFGELGAGLEVLFAVQADARTRGNTAATAGALIGRRLGHRLDGQALDLQPATETGDPSRSGVDDEAHSGHGERRFGDVRAEHDASATMRLEDAVLLRRRQAGIQRQHLDVVVIETAQGIGGVVDLPLAGQEHQHIARPHPFEFGDGVDDRLHLVAVVAERPVPNFHRKRAPGHLDHRGVDAVGGEVAGEASGVDRRRCHDHGQIRPLRQQPAQVAEDEVDVETALVGLVDDQRVVATQQTVALDLGEEDAIGHHPHDRFVAHPVVEAHGVADRRADRGVEFAGKTFGDRPRGDAAWLSVPDHPGDAPTGLDAQLRQLGALARTRLPGDDQHLVPAEGAEQLVVPSRDRQLGGIRDVPGGEERITDGAATVGGSAAIHPISLLRS